MCGPRIYKPPLAARFTNALRLGPLNHRFAQVHLVLQQHIIPRPKAAQRPIDALKGVLLVRPAVEDDGIVPQSVYLDDGMAGGLVDHLKPSHVHAAFCQRVPQKQPVPANGPGHIHLLPRLGKGQRLIKALAAAVALIMAGAYGFPRPHQMGQLIAMIDVQ